MSRQSVATKKAADRSLFNDNCALSYCVMSQPFVSGKNRIRNSITKGMPMTTLLAAITIGPDGLMRVGFTIR